MRDFLTGVVVVMFILAFATYLFAPEIFDAWLHRLFFEH